MKKKTLLAGFSIVVSQSVLALTCKAFIPAGSAPNHINFCGDRIVQVTVFENLPNAIELHDGDMNCWFENFSAVGNLIKIENKRYQIFAQDQIYNDKSVAAINAIIGDLNFAEDLSRAELEFTQQLEGIRTHQIYQLKCEN